MKYPIELYTDHGYFGPDEMILDKKEKVVKCRKPHQCVGFSEHCQKEIKPGDHAVRCTAIISGEGRRSCYVCIPCIEEHLELSGIVGDGEM